MATNSTSGNTELIIGLVGPIGTNLRGVKHVLEKHIENTGYCIKEVKVSKDVIPGLVDVDVSRLDKFSRYDKLIKAGNAAREQAKDVDGLHKGNASLACGAAAVIFSNRNEPENTEKDTQKLPNFKTAYVIDSIKRPEEVDFLRATYPHGFVLVGVYETENDRIDNLCGLYQEHMSRTKAEELIERDAAEEREAYGQRVRDTFQKADFFVHSTKDLSRLECDLERLVRIWFGDPFVTPTFDEFAMYMAFASSLRSADLSRQVGAVISRDEEILSTGANDVPKFGGGLYWPLREGACVSDATDGRDFKLGVDSNRSQQLEMVNEITNSIIENYDGIDRDELKELIESTSISDITEYGRVVHAEMEAMLSCARNAISTRGATVYSTTFPCHNCAKHIVAAGINRVLYIEPYAKSKAFEFHTDSIAKVDPDQLEYDKVSFEPFVGVGPRKFFDLFSMRHGSSYKMTRKNKMTGTKREWDIQNSQLRLQMLPNSYLDLEFEASQIFTKLQDTSRRENNVE